MLYTKIQPQSFLGSGKKDFLDILPSMDMAVLSFNCTEPFEQIGSTLSIEGPCEIWWKLLKQFQGRRHLKITQFYTCKCI